MRIEVENNKVVHSMYRNNFEGLNIHRWNCVYQSHKSTKIFSFGIHFRKENHTLKTLSNTKTEITLIALNKDADNEADHTDSF